MVELKRDQVPSSSAEEDYEYEEYHIFEEYPVEEIKFVYAPIPVDSVEYQNLVREISTEIDEIRSTLHLTNEGLEDHYSYDNKERFVEWLDEERVECLGKILELGRLAKKSLRREMRL